MKTTHATEEPDAPAHLDGPCPTTPTLEPQGFEELSIRKTTKRAAFEDDFLLPRPSPYMRAKAAYKLQSSYEEDGEIVMVECPVWTPKPWPGRCLFPAPEF